ncbi:hypothetical protein RhiirA1_458660 [Rhizophagus irregularis]|uniref:Uncharacterized protein n=1 Tax=Rhizophagus irregularis TaxID=588596 RepID=A0A2I1FJL1_9GLOM|nr:hypothetical protein RhiirA1_458660 [Rhizophagus irregularis]PKY34547.1 hypothetical protein RhiirB3_454376 [Rhizophagus irregularis]
MTSTQPQTTNNKIDTSENISPMEEIVATSSQHVLSNSEDDISSYPIETNPNKGKSIDQQVNTQQDLPNSIKIITLDNLFDKQLQTTNKAYKGFIPRDSFQPNLSNNDIITLIKTAFINDNNAFKFKINVLSTYRYFTIYFKSRDSLNQYIEKNLPFLKNIKIYDLTNTNINTLIEHKFKNLDTAVIKIMDIPYNYDTKMLLKHLANKTKSAILDHKEIKKPPRRIPGNN